MNPQKSKFQDAKILYVEDEEVLLKGITEMLQTYFSPESKGFRSLEEVSVSMELEDFKPDVVLLDCQPLRYEEDERHCDSAGDELYALFVQKKIPVILLSGLPEEAVYNRAAYQTDRPFGFFSKPVNETELKASIESCLSMLEKFQ